MTNLTKQDAIVKLNIPPTVYAIWDIDREDFYCPPRTNNNTLCNGIWQTEEEAEQDCKIENYAIISISLTDTIPDDLVRIAQLIDNDPHGLPSKEQLVYGKLRQMMLVFVLGNAKLKDQLREKHSKLLLEK